MQEVNISAPDDMHLHLRAGEMMRTVTPWSARHFRRALIMPNVPAIHTGEEAARYKAEIEAGAGPGFEVLPTIKLTHWATPGMIREARELGTVAGKIYPEGATTASHDGIIGVHHLRAIFAAMQDCGMVLCIHGEDPSVFVLDRERAYLQSVAWITRNFPGLRVVLEHITTEAAIEFVANASVNVAATITAHHLTTTLDDVIGDGCRPHLYCKPVPKTHKDRAALTTAAFWKHGGRYIFGSDSAPHRREDKESACGCAGVFSAPVALAVLAEVFLGDDPTPDRVARLQAFTSERGADFYGLPRNTGTIRLRREPWVVPAEIGGIVPFRAGETLAWQVVGRDE
jgi:dihydroorotase